MQKQTLEDDGDNLIDNLRYNMVVAARLIIQNETLHQIYTKVRAQNITHMHIVGSVIPDFFSDFASEVMFLKISAEEHIHRYM